MTKPLNTSPSCVGSIDSCMEHHSKNSLRAQVADAHDVKGEREASSLTSASVGFSLHETRSLILRLTVLVGNLCSLVLQTVPLDPAAIMVTAANAKNTNVKQDGGRSVATSTSKSSSSDRRHVFANSDVRKSLAQILSCLLDVSASASINLETAVLKKMELNRRKYPVDLCKGKAGKYTQYSHKTGITKGAGQSTLHLDVVGVGTTANQKIESPLKKKESSLSVLDLDGVTEVLGVVDIHKDGVDARSAGKAEFVTVLPALTTAIRQFAEDRLWSIYHLPRNLILALIGEIGELAELLQWKGDDDNDGSFTLTLAELDSLSQELADVTIYLIRFADVCHVSLKDEMKYMCLVQIGPPNAAEIHLRRVGDDRLKGTASREQFLTVVQQHIIW